MITLEKTEVVGFESAIRGMRNPMNSWNKSDSAVSYDGSIAEDAMDYGEDYVSHKFVYGIGTKDLNLMRTLAKHGSVHAKFRRMIVVYVDITAPLYWWKEFDTYKVGTVADSCSTMHRIHTKEFELDDFSHEHVTEYSMGTLEDTVTLLNNCRQRYIDTQDKQWWWQLIQMLPSSYNQKRTIMMNYEVLSNIYEHRKDHKLDEWKELCKWIETLPYAEGLIFPIRQSMLKYLDDQAF